jgi:hypothetical protein
VVEVSEFPRNGRRIDEATEYRFVLADDMGYVDFACFNSGLTRTPRLDALLPESVCLTQHYSGSALCAPARAALLPRRYPHRTGVIDTVCLSRLDCLATREITMGTASRRPGILRAISEDGTRVTSSANITPMPAVSMSLPNSGPDGGTTLTGAWITMEALSGRMDAI